MNRVFVLTVALMTAFFMGFFWREPPDAEHRLSAEQEIAKAIWDGSAALLIALFFLVIFDSINKSRRKNS